MANLTSVNYSNIKIEVNETVNVVSSFAEMGLRNDLRQGINNYGISQPTEIQKGMVLPIAEGRHVVIQGLSGTGKTIGVLIGTLQALVPTLRETQVLVLTPTRQLAANVEDMTDALGAFMNVRCHAFVGVMDMEVDVQLLGIGQQVVAGTPGRVLDMIRRGILSTKSVRTLVIDDAEKMMKRGFREQILNVCRHLHPTVQVVLATTRMADDISEMSSILTTNPVKITTTRTKQSLVGMKQVFVPVQGESPKFRTLCELYDPQCDSQAVIFCNTKRKVNCLSERMEKAKYSVGSLHGDMPQEQREEVLHKFCSGLSRILITTDVEAASIGDQRDLLVVNYDFPESSAQFGRRVALSSCHRASISLVKTEDLKALRSVEECFDFGSMDSFLL